MSDRYGEHRSGDGPVDGSTSLGGEPQASESLSDAEATRLYLRFGKRVLAFLIGLLRDAELAEEVCQRTFVVAVEQAGKIPAGTAGDEEDGERGRWLLTVARNEAFRLRRRQGVERRGRERAIWEFLQRQADQTADSPAAALEQAEESHRVRQALQTLPNEQRQIIEARFFKSQTFAEFAAEQQIPLGTALTRMRLALHKLRQQLLNRDKSL